MTKLIHREWYQQRQPPGLYSLPFGLLLSLPAPPGLSTIPASHRNINFKATF